MKSLYNYLLVIIFILTASIYSQSQQVIGTFPEMDGGFEGQATGTLTAVGGISQSYTDWTTQLANDGTIISTGGRSGPKYVNYINDNLDGNSNPRLHSPTSANFLATTDYVIKFFYQGDFFGATTGDIRGGIQAIPIYGSFNTNQNTGLTWTPYLRVIQTAATVQSFDLGIVSTNDGSETADFNIDDFVIYPASSEDIIVPPDVPGTGIINASGNDITVNWSAPGDVSDVVGYLILRTVGPKTGLETPNPNGIYAVGNAIGNGTVVEIVADIGVPGNVYNYTDIGAATGGVANEDYYYYAWSVDKAFNYSSNATVLPVELESFTALVSGNSVQLNWSTSTEVNNYGFEIHRSLNKTSWDNIGFVQGNGNSNSVKNYAYSDNKLSQNGIYYYRLKQVDNDGAFEYSNIVEVNFNNGVSDYFLSQNYPNPFNPSTTIKFSVEEKTHSSLVIYDLLGNEVQRLFYGEAEPDNLYEFIFDASSLASGIYYYKLTSGSFSEIRKMIYLK